MGGDRLMTDKVLGENAGIDFILVLSGETTEADLPKVHKQERIKALKRLFHIGPAGKRLPQKTYILPDLGSLAFADDNWFYGREVNASEMTSRLAAQMK